MSRPYSNESVYRAIAHRTRRRILDHLRRAEASASEIAAALDMTMRNLSPHLGVLRTTGVIVQRRRGTYRFYKLAPEQLKRASAWLRAFETAPRTSR